MSDMMQMSLWKEETNTAPATSQEVHSFIEVHYRGGERRILDTESLADREAFRDMSVLYAGFVESVANNATKRCTK